MTEPQGGSDPTQFTTRARRDGDEWVLDGWKFFSSNARTSSFLIVMAVTDPDVSAYQGMSMFLVPTDTPGRDHRAQHRADGREPQPRGHARADPLRRRAPGSTTLCWEERARPSLSRRPVSAAGASITPCGLSACARRRST